MMRVVIIGSGNLAESLSRAVAASQSTLIQLFARNEKRGRIVAEMASTVWESAPERLATADLYLIAVSDRAVGEVASSLPFAPDAIIAHTAGSVSLDALPERFAHRAVFYPLQTFTRGRAVDFAHIPIFIETSTPSLRAPMETFARSLSDTVIYADTARRTQVHLAGVFACNFANQMYALGEQIVRRAGLDFEVLKPLIAETAAKALDAHSPVEVQTGPAVRNDQATQARHLALLSDDPQIENIYSIISKNIWEISKKI
ncbi:MAG: DUF2520 domain-containing protein [Alistipes sp.]